MRKSFDNSFFLSPIFVVSVCLLFIFSSCTKNVNVAGAQGPQGPQGVAGSSDSATGNIQGKVQLYDVNGTALNDNSGASVSIENTSPLIGAISSVNGFFTFTSVHTGNYNLNVQKTGYGTMRFLNFQNTGGAQASQTGILPMGQVLDSTFNISLQADTSSYGAGSSYYLALTIKLSHPRKISNPILLFFSDTSSISNSSSLFIFRSTFYQQDDSTLSYIGFDYPLAGISDRLAVTKYLYITAAVDNIQPISYTNEQGIVIYPCAGNQSNVAKVYNVLGH